MKLLRMLRARRWGEVFVEGRTVVQKFAALQGNGHCREGGKFWQVLSSKQQKSEVMKFKSKKKPSSSQL